MNYSWWHSAGGGAFMLVSWAEAAEPSLCVEFTAKIIKCQKISPFLVFKATTQRPIISIIFGLGLKK